MSYVCPVCKIDPLNHSLTKIKETDTIINGCIMLDLLDLTLYYYLSSAGNRTISFLVQEILVEIIKLNSNLSALHVDVREDKVLGSL